MTLFYYFYIGSVYFKMSEFNAVKIISIYYLFALVACDYSYYTNYPLESDEICHIYGRKRSINLDDSKAVIVKPIEGNNIWKVGVDRTCKFVFKTSRNIGLFAVVQNLSFRSNGSDCTDYIQFKESGHKSKKFCGELDNINSRYIISDDEDDDEAQHRSKLEFKSSKGELETEIFISKKKLLPGEHLYLRIAYTPYKDCNKINDKSKYLADDNDVCIRKEYYCDGIKNCALDICQDEAGCEVISDGTGTKVTVGAVTTMLLLFLLFVMCLWTCRKHKKLCWSPDCAGPNSGEVNNQQIDLGTSDIGGRSVIPTAPMLEEVSTRPVQDKDLPPSYDSLFPEQSVPTTAT